MPCPSAQGALEGLHCHSHHSHWWGVVVSLCCQAFQDLAPHQAFLQRCSQMQNNTLITQQPDAMGTAIIIDSHPKMSPVRWSRGFSQVMLTTAVSWHSGGALCSCLNVVCRLWAAYWNIIFLDVPSFFLCTWKGIWTLKPWMGTWGSALGHPLSITHSVLCYCHPWHCFYTPTHFCMPGDSSILSPCEVSANLVFPPPCLFIQ